MSETTTNTKSQTSSRTAKQDIKTRLKRLINSPHFKFGTPQSELNPPMDFSEPAPSSNERDRATTPEAIPQAVQQTNTEPKGSFVRLDGPHATAPATHLPPSSLDQFVGWTETTLTRWQDQLDGLSEVQQRILRSDSAISNVESNESDSAISNNTNEERLPQSKQSRDSFGKSIGITEGLTPIQNFVSELRFVEPNYRFDSQHPKPTISSKSNTQTGESIVSTSETKNGGNTSSQFEMPSSVQNIINRTQAIDALVRQAFANSQTQESETCTEFDDSLQVERTTPRSNQKTEVKNSSETLGEMLSKQVASQPELETPVAPKPVEASKCEQSQQRWDDIPEVSDRNWPEMTSKMLAAGRPVLERLAAGVERLCLASSNAVVITGAAREVGTSTIAMSLARLFAERGEKILLVDADIHSAGVTRTLDLGENRSWITLARGTELTTTALRKCKNQTIAFATIQPLRLRTLWSPYVFDHLAQMLNGVRGVFDRILIDTGAVNQLLAESSGNQKLAGAGLVVAELGKLDAEATERTRRNLAGIGIEHLLFAQNFAKRT
ncbi:MAG: hypothetical protein R3C03_19105 [Pirellulaceae bacterium]